MNYSFKILHQDKRSKARLGILTCPHGIIKTPAFLPVGTQASVKSLTPEDLEKSRTQMIMINTYHLFLRPGATLIKKMGGLHKFMNNEGPIMTDSGGFQVFSLGFSMEHGVGKIIPLFGDQGEMVQGKIISEVSKRALQNTFTKFCKITEEGALFISHIDGTRHKFTPEVSCETQIQLGSDFITALDECTSPLHDYPYTKSSLERSHRWEKRSLDYLTHASPYGKRSKPVIYGVIQGGPFVDLRILSAKFVNNQDFFGVGIGGAFINKKILYQTLDQIYPYLTDLKPRHLFGIGSLDDILESIIRGVDTFDCVMPTRLGRMGHAFIHKSKIKNQRSKLGKYTLNLTNAIYKNDKLVIDTNCECYTCASGFSRAYLRHLFWAKELLAYRLVSLHNLYFFNKFMEDIRQSIINDGVWSITKNSLLQ